MDSRKMLLMNLFAGQTQRSDLWTQQEEEMLGRVEKAVCKHIHQHLQNRYPGGACCVTEETQPWAP